VSLTVLLCNLVVSICVKWCWRTSEISLINMTYFVLQQCTYYNLCVLIAASVFIKIHVCECLCWMVITMQNMSTGHHSLYSLSKHWSETVSLHCQCSWMQDAAWWVSILDNDNNMCFIGEKCRSLCYLSIQLRDTVYLRHQFCCHQDLGLLVSICQTMAVQQLYTDDQNVTYCVLLQYNCQMSGALITNSIAIKI
jgi:hypothetical protein